MHLFIIIHQLDRYFEVLKANHILEALITISVLFHDTSFFLFETKLNNFHFLEVDANRSSPMLLDYLKDVWVTFGENAHLRCEITGNPKPTITWCCNHIQISDLNFSLVLRTINPVTGTKTVKSCIVVTESGAITKVTLQS